MKLNGWSFNKIVGRDIKSDYLFILSIILIVELIYLLYCTLNMNYSGVLFSFKYSLVLILLIALIFIILDCLSYSSLVLLDIYSSIKGKTSTKSLIIVGYVLKAFLLIIISINVNSLYSNIKTLHENQSIMNMWINHHSGYTIGFSNIDENNKSEEKKLGKLTKQLLNMSGSNVIMSRNSQEFHPNVNDITPENGNIMFINKNYLKYNKIYTSKNNLIAPNDLNNKYFNILIPETRKIQKKAFSKQLKEFIIFQKEVSNNNSLKVPNFNFITIRNKNVFNYTIGKEIKDSISLYPIIVIDNGTLSNNFYWSTASQGMLQFLKLKELQKDIKKLKMSKYIVGITDAKTRLSNFNIEMTRKITILSLTTILSITQLIFVIAFISLAFLNQERQRMAIMKIFGKSNIKIIGSFLIFNLLLDVLIICISTIIGSLGKVVLLYLLPYLLIECITILAISHHAQKNLLTTLNHGN